VGLSIYGSPVVAGLTLEDAARHRPRHQSQAQAAQEVDEKTGKSAVLL
jgi:hypothetical protein